MRFAVISDIHGNWLSLQAVLQDCKGQNIDTYLFLGDYYGDSPMPNEVLACVRNVAPAHFLLGNKEQRMMEAQTQQADLLQYSQYAPVRWNLENISPQHHAFVQSLPEKLTLCAGGHTLFLAHAAVQHFGNAATERISSHAFGKEFGTLYHNHNQYLQFVQNTLNADADFVDMLHQMADGIYLFGHYHTQWHAQVGTKLFINPGSCGLPLDFDATAAYTILDIDREVCITERRVHYDVDAAAQTLKQSSLYSVAPLWHELSLMELSTAQEAVMPFLDYAQERATAQGVTARPFPDAFWQQTLVEYFAMKAWA